MTTSILPVSTGDDKAAPNSTENHENRSSYCALQWRQNQLLVKPPQKLKQPYLSSLDNQQLLIECLKHSSVNLVRIDPSLGKTKVEFWANACQQASKQIFIRIPTDNQPVKYDLWFFKLLKRSFEWIIALIMLVALSPVLLILLAMIWLESPGEIFERKWRVGERGKLFRTFKIKAYATENHEEGSSNLESQNNSNSIRYWINKYSLMNLPQLFNVIRGEMSLTGSHCWSLEDAVRLTPEAQRQLNKLPGIIHLGEVKTESNLLHLDGQTL
ncbi:MAG: heterocyst development glycosyltransferase HepC [Cyanobacteria bacterium P01_A01_bin.45]